MQRLDGGSYISDPFRQVHEILINRRLSRFRNVEPEISREDLLVSRCVREQQLSKHRAIPEEEALPERTPPNRPQIASSVLQNGLERSPLPQPASLIPPHPPKPLALGRTDRHGPQSTLATSSTPRRLLPDLPRAFLGFAPWSKTALLLTVHKSALYYPCSLSLIHI